MLTGGIVARMRGLIVKTVVAMTAVVAVVGAGVWLVGQVKLSSAKFMQNDNTGSFVVSMEDMAGISSKTDSVVVSSNLATLGDGETTGDFVTGDVTPSSSGGWENVKVEGACLSFMRRRFTKKS